MMILVAKIQIVSQPFSIIGMVVFRDVFLKQQRIELLSYFGMNLNHDHLSGFNDNINYCKVIKLEIHIKDKNMTCQGKVFMILGHKPYNNWLAAVN